jgi:hypothetical protein
MPPLEAEHGARLLPTAPTKGAVYLRVGGPDPFQGITLPRSGRADPLRRAFRAYWT